MRTLLARGLVEEAGDRAGDAARALYRTTPTSSSGWVCASLDELPELAPFLPPDDEARRADVDGDGARA